MSSLATRANSAVATNAPQSRSLAERLGYDPQQLEFVRGAIANGAPDLELEYFMRFCLAHGLDPTAKEVYYIKRNTKRDGQWVPVWTIQIGIDGYRAMAETTGEYDGQDEPTFEYDGDKKLVSATVKIYRKGMSRPFTGTARWTEYVQKDNDGKPNSMWSKMGHNQLAKCAEALALRKAFPRKLGGVYTTEEMAQAQNAPVDVTPARTLPQAGSRADQARAALAQQAQTTPAPAPTRAEEASPADDGLDDGDAVAEQTLFPPDAGDEAATVGALDDAAQKRYVREEARRLSVGPEELKDVIAAAGGWSHRNVLKVLAELRAFASAARA